MDAGTGRLRTHSARRGRARAALHRSHRARPGGTFPITAAAPLRSAEPPKFATPRHAYAFGDALAGRTERVQGLAGQGSTIVDGLFIPAALAHVGAKSAWATPAEVSDRTDRIVESITRTPAMPRCSDAEPSSRDSRQRQRPPMPPGASAPGVVPTR